jgi:hypothetical protein
LRERTPGLRTGTINSDAGPWRLGLSMSRADAAVREELSKQQTQR